MRYDYCPKCGTKLIPKQAGDDDNIPYCEPCGKYWFDTFSSCVIVMVVNEENEIALLSQGYLSDQYRNFVSGYITPGETAESTAVREVKEEIGVEVDSLEYAGTYWFQPSEALMHGYIGYAKKCDLVLSKEVDAADWVPAEEAIKYFFPKTPGNSMHPIYELYMEKTGV